MLTGSLLIVVLLLLLLYSRRSSLVNHPLDLRALTLPSPMVVDRIFSHADARYAATLPERIRKRFRRDRRTLAITWIHQVRALAIQLSREHARTVRRNPTLALRKELGIALSFVSLLISCELLVLMVSTLGPVQARVLLGQVAASWGSLQAQLQTSQLIAYNPA